jgi:hypothetical protein
MRRRWVRFLTALVVVSISALALYRGSNIVRFGSADAGLGPDGKAADLHRPQVDVPGLAFSAQESMLQAEADDQNGAAKRREQLKDILAVRPLSSECWLALSEMRLTAGEPMGKVAEAFSLSVLTGVDEQGVMSRRGVFGLSHWEVLPAEIRKRAAADLVTAGVSDRKRNILQSALSKKAESVRRDIRTELQADGMSEARLANISLMPDGRSSSN